MSHQIEATEIVKRQCCDPKKDLKACKDVDSASPPIVFYFCIHCGRHWEKKYVYRTTKERLAWEDPYQE